MYADPVIRQLHATCSIPFYMQTALPGMLPRVQSSDHMCAATEMQYLHGSNVFKRGVPLRVLLHYQSGFDRALYIVNTEVSNMCAQRRICNERARLDSLRYVKAGDRRNLKPKGLRLDDSIWLRCTANWVINAECMLQVRIMSPAISTIHKK